MSRYQYATNATGYGILGVVVILVISTVVSGFGAMELYGHMTSTGFSTIVSILCGTGAFAFFWTVSSSILYAFLLIVAMVTGYFYNA